MQSVNFYHIYWTQNLILVIDSGEFNGYGHAAGHVEARQAVCDYIEDCQGKVTTNDVILCSGCSCALDMCIAVLGDPGKNILIPRPGFSIYRTLAVGHGISVRSYDLLPERNWEADLQQMESLIDENTVALVVTNPSNPCGSVFVKDHLKEIINLAERYYLPIIADEIYEHFVFPGTDFVSVSSLSKTVSGIDFVAQFLKLFYELSDPIRFPFYPVEDLPRDF